MNTVHHMGQKMQWNPWDLRGCWSPGRNSGGQHFFTQVPPSEGQGKQWQLGYAEELGQSSTLERMSREDQPTLLLPAAPLATQILTSHLSWASARAVQRITHGCFSEPQHVGGSAEGWTQFNEPLGRALQSAPAKSVCIHLLLAETLTGENSAVRQRHSEACREDTRSSVPALLARKDTLLRILWSGSMPLRHHSVQSSTPMPPTTNLQSRSEHP